MKNEEIKTIKEEDLEQVAGGAVSVYSDAFDDYRGTGTTELPCDSEKSAPRAF